MQIREVHVVEELRAVSALFADVWGRSDEGVPIHSEVLRAVVHAGGLVNAAYAVAPGPSAGAADLVGAAVLAPTADGGGYSMIAAARPDRTDQGIGAKLKAHQRDWALTHGMDTIVWTFDPLVSRNGRFNLDKLGAVADEYERAFYGVMRDDLNGDDESDRLVVRWPLADPQTSDTGSPDLVTTTTLADGPDGVPAYLAGGQPAADRWLRVPTDIVALRRANPTAATEWRQATREWFEDAFTAGLIATGVSRDGWYHLTPKPLQEDR